MQGHLFDTGLINRVLDFLEAKCNPPLAAEKLEGIASSAFAFTVVNCRVRPNTAGAITVLLCFHF